MSDYENDDEEYYKDDDDDDDDDDGNAADGNEEEMEVEEDIDNDDNEIEDEKEDDNNFIREEELQPSTTSSSKVAIISSQIKSSTECCKLNWDAIEAKSIYNFIVPNTRVYKQMSKSIPAVASKSLVSLFDVKSFKIAYIVPEPTKNECFYNRSVKK